MTAARPERSGNTLIAVVGVVAALADGILAALGATAWRSYQDDGFAGLTAQQAGPFVVMGVSAAAGAVLALLAMVALVRGRRGLAQGTYNLSWLRLGGVLVALLIVALTVGVSVTGVPGMVLAVGDAFGGLIVTGVAARRTRDENAVSPPR